MPSSFSTVKDTRGSLGVEAASVIRQRIESGELAAGDRLPAERVLSERLGISRPVLREAFKILESVGLVEARVGRGRFVVGLADAGRSASLVRHWLLIHREEAEHLNEIRTAVEGLAVRTVEPAAGREAAVRLRALTAEARDAVRRGDAVRAASCDREFHGVLTDLSANSPLKALSHGLIDAAHQVAAAVYAVPEAADASLHQHDLITEAIEIGDAQHARALLEEHFSSSIAVASGLEPAGGVDGKHVSVVEGERRPA